MIRSSEFKRSKGAAASKPLPLHHLRVIPHEDGVTVTHHASMTAPAHATHEFGHGDGEKFMDHMDEHAGMAMGAGEPEAHSSKATGGFEAE